MPNWESETNRRLSEEKSEINLKIEKVRIGNIERENQVEGLIKSYYEQLIVPGYKTLDAYRIRESLLEISNQIWGGQVEKGIESLDQYIALSKQAIEYKLYIHTDEYGIRHYPGQFSLSDDLKKTIEEQLSKDHAIYTLSSQYVWRRYRHEFSDGGDTILEEQAVEKLSVLSSSDNILIKSDWIISTDDSVDSYCDKELRNLKNTDRVEVEKWIHDRLLEECVKFKKRRFNTINSTHKRSFLDRLLGK